MVSDGNALIFVEHGSEMHGFTWYFQVYHNTAMVQDNTMVILVILCLNNHDSTIVCFL